MNVSIKQIKGKKYVYLEDYVKVNKKSKKISIYMGKYPIKPSENIQLFLKALGTLELKKLNVFTAASLKKYLKQYLSEKEALDLEVLRYSYVRFKGVRPDEAKRYEDVIYTKYSQGSTAIEGNTLTLREAHLLLDEGVTPQGKDLREVYELVNFKDLRMYIKGYKGDITESFIKKVHSILMNNLLESPGEYRRIFVLIEGADYEPPPAFEVQDLMRELVQWYNHNKDKMHSLELAGVFHARFETIHPFIDGNGRVGRALMNFILEKRGYPLIYLGLEHRNEYIDAVANANKEDYKPLIKLLSRVLKETHHRITEDFQASLKPDSREISKLSEYIRKASGL